jgi:hypothetical protein
MDGFTAACGTLPCIWLVSDMVIVRSFNPQRR